MLRTFDLRLRPKGAQRSALDHILTDSVETYNAAFEHRREAWKLCQERITYYDQQAELTELRKNQRFAKVARGGAAMAEHRAPAVAVDVTHNPAWLA